MHPRILICSLLLSCLFSFQAWASSPSTLPTSIDDFFVQADAFFKKYAKNGSIRYQALKADDSDLMALIKFVGQQPLEEVILYKRKAYLINCYNLCVIQGVIDKYPVPTVRNTDGFFKKVQYNIGGQLMTLDYLEYKVIFKEFNDPRLHFVLVCAAKGCPPIPSYAYNPSDVSEQINRQCQMALDNPEFLYLENEVQLIKLSPIFQWYADDFFPSIQEFINAHRTEPLPADYSLDYYEYDWRLNTWEE